MTNNTWNSNVPVVAWRFSWNAVMVPDCYARTYEKKKTKMQTAPDWDSETGLSAYSHWEKRFSAVVTTKKRLDVFSGFMIFRRQ